jgi:hypothetical protein
MNHKNEFVGVDEHGRKCSKRKLEHRHGNRAKRLAKATAKKR